MRDWQGSDSARATLAFSALLFLGIWLQLTLMHWAGGFKQKAMWGPVLLTPLFAAAAVAGAVTRAGRFGWVVAGMLALAIVEGLVGVALHVRGIAAQVGGISLRNILSGPPPLLPLAYALVGVLALGALTWGG